MTARLHRYWFRFNGVDRSPCQLGCGVTAWTAEDALALMCAGPFQGRQIPEVAEIITDVDVSTLDPGHVLPNMETPTWRGVWFPKGFHALASRA